jgi:hypothetical protein
MLAPGERRRTELSDQLDLDAGAQRDLRHAKRAARMRTLVAKHRRQTARSHRW